jgi:hypothetical protein
MSGKDWGCPEGPEARGRPGGGPGGRHVREGRGGTMKVRRFTEGKGSGRSGEEVRKDRRAPEGQAAGKMPGPPEDLRGSGSSGVLRCA